MNRVLWIDLIKVFATFCVVLLHTTAPVVDAFSNISGLNWNFGNMYGSVVRMAVPLFFMVTGVLLLNTKEETLNMFFRKRFMKVVIPLVAWTIIYILFRKYMLDKDISIMVELFKSILVPRYYHLWFLYAIIGIYLFIPIFKIFVNNASRRMQWYFLILWVIFASFSPLVGDLVGYNIPNHMPMLTGHFGYLLLGYVLAKMDISKTMFYGAFFIILLSSLVTYFGTIYLSIDADKFVGVFYSSLSTQVIFLAASYFIIIKYISEKVIVGHEKFRTATYTIGVTSLGIYLIHPMILFFLQDIGMYALNGESTLVMVPLTAIITFILSFIIVLILRKIPIVKLIVP